MDLRSAFSEMGFDLRSCRGHLRLVRGRCEVQARVTGDRDIAMSIPIVRLGPERPLSAALAAYLDDRNRTPTGPGVFVVEEDVVYYRAAANLRDGVDRIARVALAMQETVEHLGPKILNVLGQ